MKKRGGADYYSYIAVDSNTLKILRRLKLEIEYALGREVKTYKLIPMLLDFLLSKKDTMVKEFINWAGNRIATIYKRED